MRLAGRVGLIYIWLSAICYRLCLAHTILCDVNLWMQSSVFITLRTI